MSIKKITSLWIVSLLLTVLLINVVPIQIEEVIASSYEEDFVSGEIIIKFSKNIPISLGQLPSGIITTGLTSIDNLLQTFGITEIQKIFETHVSDSLSNIYKLTLSGDTDIIFAVDSFVNNKNIEYAEPNYVSHACGTIPNDSQFPSQWALNQPSDHDIDAPEAWDIEKGNKDIVIAVLDSGIDWEHPDLAGTIWNNVDENPENGIDDDNNGYIDDIRGWNFINNNNFPMDDNGHGTHCSGIIGAVSNNSVGVAGICWNCTIMPVKVLKWNNTGDAITLSKGIVYAVDNGADIISMSLAYNFSSPLEDAVDYAYNKGVCLVAAAGNDDASQKRYPAAFDNVIAVAATDNNDARWSYEQETIGSNYGNWIDVSAPGSCVLSLMPIREVYMNFLPNRCNFSTIYDLTYQQNYDSMSGTSMACPHVAALAALLLSKNPNLTPSELRSIIRDNTDPYNSPVCIGTGRINAYKALRFLDSTIEPTNCVYVDDDNTGGPWLGTQEHPLQHIQDGIEEVSDTGTVKVLAGIYTENLVINKTIKILGENQNTTVISGNGDGDVVRIISDNVEIDGCTITNGDRGIHIWSCHRTKISHCTIHENYNGIYLDSSIRDFDGDGDIDPYDWSLYAGYWGSFHQSQISYCNISNNSALGICIATSSNNQISNCYISHNGYHGIKMDNANNNIIHSCYLINNGESPPIYLNLDFTQALNVLQSDNNHIVNNYFDNIINAVDAPGDNTYNISDGINYRELYIGWPDDKNIIGGENLGGNFWNDYRGFDLDGDGIGDTDLPFNSNGINGGDFKPLIHTGWTQFTCPYDQNSSREGQNSEGWYAAETSCNKSSGEVGVVAEVKGTGSCYVEALQGINFYVNRTKTLYINVELLYIEGVGNFVGAAGGTKIKCYLDYINDDYVRSEELTQFFTWEDAIRIGLDFIGPLFPELWIVDIFQLIYALNSLNDALKLQRALRDNDGIYTNFNFTWNDIEPGDHTIWSGVSAKASSVLGYVKALIIGQVTNVTIYGISPPSLPRIEGPEIGSVGDTLSFSVSSIDVENDDIQYQIDWGDGIISPWTAIQESNTECILLHNYQGSGSYDILVKARDTDLMISEVAHKMVTINPISPIIKIEPSIHSVDQKNDFCIQVHMNSNGQAVRTAGFQLTYPTIFTVKNLTYENLLGTNVLQMGSPSLGDNSGFINYAITRTDDNSFPVNGKLVTICFTAPATAGTYSLDLHDVILVDESGNPLVGVVETDATIIVNTSIVDKTTVYVDPSSQVSPVGGPFTVNIGIDPTESISGAQCDVYFDPSLLSVDLVEDGGMFDMWVDSQLEIDNENGIIQDIAAFDLGDVSTSGTFAIISFTAKNQQGTSVLNLTNIIVGTPGGESLPIIVYNGSVTVLSEPEDVNTDGEVNILDLILIGQHWGETGPPCWILADVNCDGVVNILDMILVGQHWTG